MRVLLVVEGDLASGRGTVVRVLGILPHVAEAVELHLCSLTLDGRAPPIEVVPLVRTHLSLRIAFRGWAVENARALAGAIREHCSRWSIDLVVLSWEIWDLIEAIGESLAPTPTTFATYIHSTPFLDAPPSPSSSFYHELLRRIWNERNPSVIGYLLRKSVTRQRVLRTTHAIAVNQTVAFYLRMYYPWLRFSTLSHSYALDWSHIESVGAGNSGPELVYMARLVHGKGVFELPEILRRINDRRETSLSVLGRFSEPSDERRFIRCMQQRDLVGRFTLHGWVSGDRKYELLKSSKVFVYPSLYSDTFSIALLEAIACRLRVVSYDVPFVRDHYDVPFVTAVPFRSRIAFAEAVLRQLDQGAPKAEHIARVASTHASWARVAQADLRAYEQALMPSPGDA